MPGKVKKVLHPLLFTAVVSAIAVVIVEKTKRRGAPLMPPIGQELLREFTHRESLPRKARRIPS